MAMLRTCALVSVAVSTILLRLGAYIYLRWIPFHMLWPAVILFWILFILSFILLLYLDLESPLEPTITVETTDIIEVVSNGPEKTIVETEIDAVAVEQPRQTTWMETIYLGIPNSNPILSFMTIAINAGMLMMTLDLTFRTYLFYPATDLMFHRPVPTSPFSANIFIRSPPESPLPLRVFYKPVDVTSWETGPVAYEFDNSTDFTTVVTLDGLAPSTPYNYAVLPPDMDIDMANSSSFGNFETFPHHGKNGRWSFGSSSCILPHVPYNPLHHPLHIQGLEYLEKDMPNLKFFTFLGDFIYADVPHKPLPTPESFFMQYRQVYASPSFSPLLPHLPIYHVNDDHDISNDYDQGPDTSLYKNASTAFNAYHRAANPASPYADTNYFWMDYGDTSFFFLDTRRYRSSNFAEDKEGKTMLGEKQLSDLLSWAVKAEERGVVWKFIISSVPMTNNWKGPDGQRDTWGGFMHERGKILDVLKDVSNVVVISGDRHEAAVTQLPSDVLEISVSPLNQFYTPIRTYHSSETDKQIAYYPDGNQKYGIYTIDTTNPEQLLLEVQIKIKGGIVWKHVFTGKKVGKKNPVDRGVSLLEKGWSWLEKALRQQPLPKNEL